MIQFVLRRQGWGFLEVGHIGKVTGMSETPLGIFFSF